MKLWEYIKEKMLPYRERMAFPEKGITYGELLKMKETKGERRLRICEGKTRGEQGLEILRSIASGATTVPLSKEYGDKNKEGIRKEIESAGKASSDVAFVVFTSGTTGNSKGVMLTDENIITNLEYISTYFRLEGIKRMGIMRPLVHISALVGELLYGLICGLEIYFFEEAFLPQRLMSFLREKKIEVFNTTPTVWLTLLKYSSIKSFPVRVSAISGERLTEKSAKEIAEAFPETEFYNVYGLTEHSARACALMPEDFVRKAGSIGKPLGNVYAKIEEGELLLKSPSVMKGYFKDEEKSKKKIKNGWLYTGDMAYKDEEGYYYIEGRKDDMLIRAGINIFPEEIEEEVKKCPNVEDCIVCGRTGEDGVTEICLKYMGTSEPWALRKQLAGRLNAHFMPNRIEQVTEIERTASGKKVRR